MERASRHIKDHHLGEPHPDYISMVILKEHIGQRQLETTHLHVLQLGVASSAGQVVEEGYHEQERC